MITYEQGRNYLSNFSIETQKIILNTWTRRFNGITGVYSRTQMYQEERMILKKLWKWHEIQVKLEENDGLDIYD